MEKLFFIVRVLFIHLCDGYALCVYLILLHKEMGQNGCRTTGKYFVLNKRVVNHDPDHSEIKQNTYMPYRNNARCKLCNFVYMYFITVLQHRPLFSDMQCMYVQTNKMLT